MAHFARFASTSILLSGFVTACAIGVEDETNKPIVAVQDSEPAPAMAGAADDSDPSSTARGNSDPVYFGEDNVLDAPADVDSAPSYTFELIADAHMTIELQRRNEDGPSTIGFTLHRVVGPDEYNQIGKVYGHHGAAAMSLYTVHGGTYAIRLLDGLNPASLVLNLSCNSGTCAARRQPGETCGEGEGMQCDQGLACVFESGACNASEAPARCQVVPDECPKSYAPVCGCNGETWGNACFAYQAGVSILHDGDCKAH